MKPSHWFLWLVCYLTFLTSVQVNAQAFNVRDSLEKVLRVTAQHTSVIINKDYSYIKISDFGNDLKIPYPEVSCEYFEAGVGAADARYTDFVRIMCPEGSDCFTNTTGGHPRKSALTIPFTTTDDAFRFIALMNILRQRH